MHRNKEIKNIRPTLDLDNEDKKLIESFQNKTLRPILKFQNDVILSLVKHHKNYNSKIHSNDTKQQCETNLRKFFQSNMDLKNQLIGITIGFCTDTELEFYHENRKELSKRIIQMQVKRFLDAVYQKSQK